MAKVSVPAKCRYCGFSYPMVKSDVPGEEEYNHFCTKKQVRGEDMQVDGDHAPPKECPLRQRPGWKT